MKKLVSILLCLCLMFIPMNIMALEPVDIITNINDTPIDVNDIATTYAPGSPEEQAVQKILAHKKAMGEEIPNQTRLLTEDLVDGGVYYIKNYFSGKYLNVHYGVDANGTNVYQWTGDSSTEQKFKVVYHSATNSYKIYAMCSSNGTNRVLDVVRNGAALASGQNVDIWTPVDHTAQRLILTPLILDNLFHIQMLGNKDLYFTTIDKSNGTSGGTKPTSAGNVFIQTFNLDDHQQWQFIRISSAPVTPPTPTYSDPYGWLDEVTENGIRGWAWCEDLPNTPLNIELRLYNNNTSQSYTIPLTANIYRSDVENAGFGNGYHGFHYNIDWSEYPVGTYTVRAFAGVNSPTKEIHDSPMTFHNTLVLSYSISENETIASNLFANSMHSYIFEPTTTGTYVVQTFGNADTVGALTINDGTEVRNDNSDSGGVDDNFKITFYAREGETVTIIVECGHQSQHTGNYSIKLHKATAQIYSFETNYAGYDYMDTTIYSNVPRTVFNYYGYDVKNNENKEYQHILQNENTNFQRINSEIVYFAGHGDKSIDESFLIFNNLSSRLSYNTMNQQVADMSNVKIAVWANCFSSLKNMDGDKSIARLAHTKGAEVSIGWYNEINNIYAGRWTNNFFEYLETNHTVEQAITYANSKQTDPNSELIHKLAIYGNTAVKIIPSTCPFHARNMSNNTNILPKLDNNDYKVYTYDYGGKRYVRLINGIITNDFYQVSENGYTIKSDNTFTDSEIAQLERDNTQKNIYSQSTLNELNNILNIDIDLSTVQDDKEIYYKTNGNIYHLRAIKDDNKCWYVNLSTGTICSEEIDFF